MVYFATHGKLNPDRHMGADGWITDGEKSGSISIVFDTGDTITRSRKLGKSTQLKFNEAKGDEAQALIIEALGVTADDFLATCYFQQRQMARLVLAQPTTRMEYVSAWFQLAPLENGEEKLRNELASLSWQADTQKQRLAQLKLIEAQELGQDGKLETVGEQIKEVQTKRDAAQAKYKRLQELLEKNGQLAQAPLTIAEYDNLCAELFDAKQSLLKEGVTLDDRQNSSREIQIARDASVQASRNMEQKRRLAAGEFDGHCPIAEIQCPAKAQINASRTNNKKLFQDAELAHERAESESNATSLKNMQVIEAYDAQRRIEDRVNALSQRVEKLKSGYELAKQSPPAMDPQELRDRLNAAQREVTDLQLQQSSLQRSLTVVSEARREAVEINTKLDALNKKVETHREALAIFGKQGAQRRVAETALNHIQRDANDMLSECGIKLEVDVSWSREGSGVAKTCDTCGHPFPPSAKVKQCEKCQSPRGANLVNKLDILLSDQSGAAEDLAGAAVQLGASAWLRANRGVRFATALIDEPFSACDAANKRSLANYLSRMLTRPGGFEQALVISHDSSTNVFPGVIEVVGNGKTSTAHVL